MCESEKTTYYASHPTEYLNSIKEKFDLCSTENWKFQMAQLSPGVGEVLGGYTGDYYSGSTAGVAFVAKENVFLASVGDSKVVAISQSSGVVGQTRIHNAATDYCALRFPDASGWRIKKESYIRLGDVGSMGVTRSFGDRHLKAGCNGIQEGQGLSHVFELEKPIPAQDVQYLVGASDGVWDVIDTQSAASLLDYVFQPSTQLRRQIRKSWGSGVWKMSTPGTAAAFLNHINNDLLELLRALVKEKNFAQRLVEVAKHLWQSIKASDNIIAFVVPVGRKGTSDPDPESDSDYSDTDTKTDNGSF